MVEDLDLRVVVTQLTERLAAQADRQAEAARVQNDRMTQLAQDLSAVVSRVSQFAEHLPSQYVPREIFEGFRRQNDAMHLDTQGDLAKTILQLEEFRQEVRKDRERERLRLEQARAEDARARKNLGVAIAGIVASLVVGLLGMVIGVLEL